MAEWGACFETEEAMKGFCLIFVFWSISSGLSLRLNAFIQSLNQKLSYQHFNATSCDSSLDEYLSDPGAYPDCLPPRSDFASNPHDKNELLCLLLKEAGQHKQIQWVWQGDRMLISCNES